MNMEQETRSAAIGGVADVANEKGFEKCFRFGETFAGVSGHFPGNPIIPAVVQVLMARLVVEEKLGRGFSLVEITNAKFRHMLTPGMEIRVRCKEASSDRGLRYTVTLTIAAGKASNFNMVLVEKDGHE